MNTTIRFAVPTLALLACSSASMEDLSTTQDPSSTQQEPFAAQVPHVLPFKDSRPGGGGSSSNLIDHGGKVLPVSSTYAIFWGDPTAFPSDAKVGLDAMFNGLTGTSYLGILTQYMRTDGGAPVSSFHTNWTDTTSTPPTRSPSVSLIGNEVCKVIQANGAVPDSNGIYFVYTSNFPHENTYCAWHSYATCNGTTIQLAYMPNVAGVAGCSISGTFNCNGYSLTTQSLANISAHEGFEAATDSTLSAWYSANNSEISDLCSWRWSSCVSLTTGNWQLQEQWSNAAGACVQE